MGVDIKTVDDSNQYGEFKVDPLNGVKREAIDRMRSALVACQLDEPFAVSTALKTVTMMRVQHQITRIIQYIDLMDKLEAKLYETVENDLATSDFTDPTLLSHLVNLQYSLQKNMIESNKLLMPFLDIDQYPAFSDIVEVTPVNDSILSLPSQSRDKIRKDAGEILKELELLNSTEDEEEIEAEIVAVES